MTVLETSVILMSRPEYKLMCVVKETSRRCNVFHVASYILKDKAFTAEGVWWEGGWVVGIPVLGTLL